MPPTPRKSGSAKKKSAARKTTNSAKRAPGAAKKKTAASVAMKSSSSSAKRATERRAVGKVAPAKPPLKPPVRKPVRKPVLKPVPAPGVLGTTLVSKLKAAPTGTPTGTVVMETLRSLPPEQLKAEFLKAGPKLRQQFFRIIPPEQIAGILASLPSTVLEPPAPPVPPPSPTGGPPASILMTSYQNAVYPPAQQDPGWAQKITNGDTVGLNSVIEWVPVYNHDVEREGGLENPMVGLTGWVVPSPDGPFSNADVWFVHPFGFDFEWFIAPDPAYEGLLGAHNAGPDAEYAGATGYARKTMGLPVLAGVLGCETDQELIPPDFQGWITEGARIACFGRWIVDCGHDDFHTEIHPPGLIAIARPMDPPAGVQGASERTHVVFMSRPYTVSQVWSEGNFVEHLLAEVGKVETTIFGIPLSWRVEAHPHIYATPFEGRPYIKLLVQPPVQPHTPVHLPVANMELALSFHFTHRHNVAVQLFDAGNNTVGIIIVFGDMNPAPLPTRRDLTVQWSELGDKYSYVIDALQIIDILKLDIAPAIILNEGILTDRYDPPQAQSPLDNQNIVTNVGLDALQTGAGLSEDDGQSFPIYGWLDVYWREKQIVAKPPIG
jgi:hypothetical protein